MLFCPAGYLVGLFSGNVNLVWYRSEMRPRLGVKSWDELELKVGIVASENQRIWKGERGRRRRL